MARVPFAAAPGILALLLTISPAAAQQTSGISEADVLRLQDSVYLAERDLADLRGRDEARAEQLRMELDNLRDEVIYLKVKLRKERTVDRREYADVRDRIADVRVRARGDTAGAAATRTPSAAATSAPGAPRPAPTAVEPKPTSDAGAVVPPPRATTGTAAETAGTASLYEIPAGTELDVRLQNTLNSGTAHVEDRFEGTTVVDLTLDGRTLIPAGSVLRGVVTSVEPASRTNRTARLSLSFDEMTVEGRDYEIRGTVTEAIEGEGIKGEAGRIGAGAGVGAIIGGILGGFKGALAGILIGGGGVIAATEGKEVELPQGTLLRVRIDSPVSLDPLRR